MQNLEGSGTPVLYIGRTVLKVKNKWIYTSTCTCALLGLFYVNFYLFLTPTDCSCFCLLHPS
jgi:hypothetical protein